MNWTECDANSPSVGGLSRKLSTILRPSNVDYSQTDRLSHFDGQCVYVCNNIAAITKSYCPCIAGWVSVPCNLGCAFISNKCRPQTPIYCSLRAVDQTDHSAAYSGDAVHCAFQKARKMTSWQSTPMSKISSLLDSQENFVCARCKQFVLHPKFVTTLPCENWKLEWQSIAYSPLAS